MSHSSSKARGNRRALSRPLRAAKNGGAVRPVLSFPARPTKPFRVEFDRLTTLGRITRSAAAERLVKTERVLRILVASGRGAMLRGSTPPLVLIPLRRSIRLVDGESVHMLRAGQIYVAEGGRALQAVGVGGRALWIAMVAPASVWRQLFDASTEHPFAEPVLLPATHDADRALRRAAVQAARSAARAVTEKCDAMSGALRFATLLADLQSVFNPMIKRCPGRTLAQRRSVFLRLQRAYNRIDSNSHLELGVGAFARSANYSTCHFVRTFNAVYGETPYSLIMERRLRRALRLVHDTELSITEVALASGFEDRCAFARSFKRRFGQSATAVRSRPQAIAV